MVKDVPAGARLFGYPARPGKESLRIDVSLEKLPELLRDVRKIKATLGLEDHE